MLSVRVPTPCTPYSLLQPLTLPCAPPLHLRLRARQVRTYTALLTAMGNAKQWTRAVDLLFAMQVQAG